MCMHPFKNWELNESLDVLNDFTSDFNQIEIKERKTNNSEIGKESLLTPSKHNCSLKQTKLIKLPNNFKAISF